MRSFFALGALALSSSLELAAAANCRPSGTTTSAAPSSSETGSSGGNKVVRNLVANGGCNELNPNDPSDIPNFHIEGSGQGVTGQGYTGGGSKETNCASLAANGNPRRKRALGPSVSISQDLSNLNKDSLHTIQFFYRITSHPGNTGCLLSATLGGAPFYSAEVDASEAGWIKVLEQITPPSETSPIDITMTCEGDDATILIDSIFVSDAVTPETIDDYILDFGDGGAQQTDAATGSVTASETAVETASETDAQTEESTTEATDTSTVTETSAGETTTAEETSSGFETTTVAETSSAAETSAADETTTVEQTSAAETSTAEVESTTVTSAASETTSAAEEEQESTTTTPATETTSTAEEEDQTTTASTSAATATDGCLPSTWDDGPVFCEPKLETEDTFCAVQGNAPSIAFELLDLSRYPWQGYAERCATICQQTEGCNVFGYTDERCAIASVNTVSDIEWESGGDEADMMEWSNLDCFVCDETCIVTNN
ncbi:hypothetical protein LCI18_013093 [Fusarium solani-melongenae]|uniref:Uncharacterized protein n=1 Tax=Fusarium solani subsp. cucurbitae TaxID=2747967 RepID=A0ACD3ZLF3_FUSSC|nr:hypothetical protein LCI18_013093 [Fusarium solani-melongenae]